ncbi:transposable element Tc1 transposase [Trichonephila clavipes]|uniref:Transposable element Tc1 transposase n=1 Tax=Trichonephila clavipes TaxID=2585209 RepID=A0A8X6RIC9_TRICX|nr:transposable element Tc1 transposase [Trichonephila clavipes]
MKHGYPISPRNESSSRWDGDTHPLPSRAKPNKRIMATVFLDQRGVLLVDFMTQGTTINSGAYCATLRKLRRALQNKRRGMQSKGVLLLHDNAKPHTSRTTRNLIESFGLEVLDHAPYNPTLLREVKFEQISVFERGRIVVLREAGLSYRAVAARVQRNSSTIMRVSKQWTNEGRTARKSVSGPRNGTSAREDRRLVRMDQTDRTAFSRQLAAQWSIATRVSLCASSIRRRVLQRGLRARIPLYRIPLTQNHRRLRLQWANVHRSWRADWQQVIFLTNPASICGTMLAEFESGSMPVNGAFRSALSNATVDEHPELWSGVP